MTNTPTESPPLISRTDAPGPLMVRLVPIVSGVLTVMVVGRGRLKLIVSPAAALVIAARNEPEPLSFVFVTVMMRMLPKTGRALRRTRAASPDHTPFNALADVDGLIHVPPLLP